MSLQIGLSIAQRMKQELKLTPQLQLSIRHLQLARTDLIEEIQRELMSNPLLEEQGGTNTDSASSADTSLGERSSSEGSGSETLSHEGAERASDGLDFESISQSAEARQEMDWDQYFDERRPRRELDPIKISQEDYFSPEQHYTRSASLSEHLLEQIQLLDFSVSEREIAEELIWNLDERGYLVGVSAEDIAQMLEVDVELVEEVIESLLQFDPIGVCARDLRECLLAQCRAQKTSSLVVELIEEHLEDANTVR